MTNLETLLANVEAGNWKDAMDQRSEFDVFRKQKHWQDFDKIMLGDSLNAAQRLHEAFLPGWGATISVKERDDGFVRAWVSENSNHVDNARHSDCRAYKISPARAWLIAIIKALIEKEGK